MHASLRTALDILQELLTLLATYGPAVVQSAVTAFLAGGWPAVELYLLGLFTPAPTPNVPTPAPSVPASIQDCLTRGKAVKAA